MSEKRRNLPSRYSHPLTEEFIKLVGGGLEPREAAMRLVGPLLPLHTVENALFDWECDYEVCERIDALISERVKAAQTVRQATIERLIGVINSDVRQFFRKVGDEMAQRTELVPITEWSKAMSASVKKVKFRQKTDPFGNTTETVDLEFYDPSTAIKDLREIAPEVFEIIKLNKGDEVVDAVVLEKLSDEELAALQTKLLKAV